MTSSATNTTITAVRPLVMDTGQGRTLLFVLVDTAAGVTGVGEGGHVSLERLRARPGLGIDFDEAVARRHERTL